MLAHATIREPADLAALLRANPGERDVLIRLAHQRYGNAFVAEAIPLIALTDQQARSAAPGTLPGQATLRGERVGDELIDPEGEILTYNAASVLPFGGPKGWNATAILTNLGQRDTMSQTDSDGHRCVQAAGIASHVLRGPDATLAYLQHMLGDAAHGATSPTPRQTSARAIISRVCDRIRDRVATFQDLSWAQEAIHDSTVADSSGTPESQTLTEIAPSTTSETTPMHTWCKTAQDVIAAAHGLRDGEQFIAMCWAINFNSSFTHYEDDNPGEHPDQIDVGTDEHHRWVHRAQLQRGRRPDPEKSDPGRDQMAGHQVLIVREGGELRIYDPEQRAAGHYLPLDAASLHPLFVDEAQFDAYRYVRIEAKVKPR